MIIYCHAISILEALALHTPIIPSFNILKKKKKEKKYSTCYLGSATKKIISYFHYEVIIFAYTQIITYSLSQLTFSLRILCLQDIVQQIVSIIWWKF